MKTTTVTKKTKSRLLTAVIKARKKAGVNISQAAEASTISQPSWSRIESGVITPTFETVFDMAKAVGFKVTLNF